MVCREAFQGSETDMNMKHSAPPHVARQLAVWPLNVDLRDVDSLSRRLE